MKKHNLLKNLSRFLLWSHVIGVVGFYLVLWLRSSPAKEDRVKKSASKPENPEQSANYPLVSIIVPARNEERNIRRCVESLLEQSYPNYEVIVVDDGSTDADTWHAPNALQWALTSALNTGSDLYSLGTAQELPGFWEKVMMPMAYLGISMMYPIKKVNDPLSSVAIANGQFILIRRVVYEILGGYARPELRNTLLDDRDLAYTVKQQGFRLRLEDGRDLVHVQMYHGLREAWRGWRKNAFLGTRGGFAFFVLQLIGLPMVAIAPFLLPLVAWISRQKLVRGRVITTSEIGAATLLELGPLLAYHLSIDKELKVPWYY